ncbi:MAG: helix-turn-helix domain-containing protein [Candidatus Komeilibacteria bacterium]
MSNGKKQLKATDFNEYLEQELKDPEFKRLYDHYGRQLKIAYAINHIRRQQKITQSQMAKKLATSQSNIARLESGQQNFTIKMLDKIAKALDKQLVVSFK